MSETKEDFEKINRFLKLAQTINKFKNCNTVYELFNITDKNAPYPYIEKIINSFVDTYKGTNAKIFLDLGRVISREAETVKRVLRDHRRAYDEYLQEHDPRIQKVREQFAFCTKRDNKMDSKEKADLIEEAKDVGLSDAEALALINKWLIECGVEESEDRVDSSATSPARSFTDFLAETYYEILGVSDDADYAKIKDAYDREHIKYNETRDKAKASARFFVVSEAWECLRDPTKRREYDEKLKQPKTPVPTGKPKLVVECKSDYTYKNIRRGVIFTEKIIIKNTEGGLLQGTIKSDSPWLEPDRNKILEKHEQDLYLRILTSKIPPKTYKVAGNIDIDSNGGKHKIPFNLFLENYELELKRFRGNYVPLVASILGFLCSFILGPNLSDLAVLGTFVFAVWFKIQENSVKGTRNDLEIIKKIGAGLLIGVGGLIAFGILAPLIKQWPHFSGFLIGSYLFGSFIYLSANKILEYSIDNEATPRAKARGFGSLA